VDSLVSQVRGAVTKEKRRRPSRSTRAMERWYLMTPSWQYRGRR